VAILSSGLTSCAMNEKSDTRMAIDDKLEKVLDKLWEESLVPHRDLELLSAAISAIPVAGGPISALMSGLAKRRVVRRTVEMFNAMRERLEQVDETKINKEFFESDEFQTLLALAIEQLQTSHDSEKIKMIAAALANGGIADFTSENRKELFVRILRDLSVHHLRLLKTFLPRPGTPGDLPSNLRRRLGPTRREPKGQELALLQKLVSNGLIEESFGSKKSGLMRSYSSSANPSRTQQQLKKYIDQPPSRTFSMSELGLDFLGYLGQDKAVDEPTYVRTRAEKGAKA